MNLYDLFIAPMQYPFMLRALITSVVVGVTCGIMGSYMLVKRWSLMGDAISHAVLPGVAIAYLLGWPFFLGSLVTGLLTAIGIGFVERNSRIKSDAAMGILFIAAFALGLALLSRMRSSVDLYHILFGNILAVSPADLWLTSLSGLAVVLAVALLWKELHIWSFDVLTAQVAGIPVRALHYLTMFLLSVTIVASLQAVGIVLVIAMLITPVATAYLLTQRFVHMMLLGSGLGAAAGVMGLYLSFHLNIASGATMVLVSTLLFLLALVFSPSQGVLWRILARHRAARAIAADDSLKAIYELTGNGAAVTVDAVAGQVGDNAVRVRGRVAGLSRRGLVTVDGDNVRLTGAGHSRALTLVRSHRLWERFLTDHAGLPWDAVHEEAHRLEHVTTAELADILAAEMGHPEHDPHGAPIPSREGTLPVRGGQRLDTLAPGARATVVRVSDEDSRALRQLERLGLLPGAQLAVRSNPANGPMVVEIDGKTGEIPRAVAGQITVTGAFTPAGSPGPTAIAGAEEEAAP